MPRSSSNARIFWGVIALVVILDLITKGMAVGMLVPEHIPHPVFGMPVRLTLVYNPGAAFGLNLGPWSRWIFMALTVGALGVLWRLYQATRPEDRLRALALALVCAGALGNLLDRIRSPRGVVDFIDIGVSEAMRWPTFNVADMAVSTGAFLLAWVLWGEEEGKVKRMEAAAAAGTPVSNTLPEPRETP